jgi:hypothetical protein
MHSENLKISSSVSGSSLLKFFDVVVSNIFFFGITILQGHLQDFFFLFHGQKRFNQFPVFVFVAATMVLCEL